MIKLELTAAEADALQEILTTYESDLHTEISHTDNRDLRSSLKERGVLVKNLMARLAAMQKETGGAEEPVPQI